MHVDVRSDIFDNYYRLRRLLFKPQTHREHHGPAFASTDFDFAIFLRIYHLS
jgi:hypothetical protein